MNRTRHAFCTTVASLLLYGFGAAAQPAPTATPESSPPPPTPPSTAAPPPTAPAAATQPTTQVGPLGEAGESCRARSDCRANLRCVENVCTDENEGVTCSSTPECGGTLRCIDNRCTSPHSRPSRDRDRDRDEDEDEESPGRRLRGVRPYFGLVATGGLTGALVYETSDFGTSGSAMFGVRAGILANQTELGFEISPVTFFPVVDGGDPVLQANAGVGHYLRLADRVYWPLRFGAGVVAVNLPNDDVLFQSRIDLVGFAYHANPVLIELHAPTVRFATEFDTYGAWSWLFGLSFSVLAGKGK